MVMAGGSFRDIDLQSVTESVPIAASAAEDRNGLIIYLNVVADLFYPTADHRHSSACSCCHWRESSSQPMGRVGPAEELRTPTVEASVVFLECGYIASPSRLQVYRGGMSAPMLVFVTSKKGTLLRKSYTITNATPRIRNMRKLTLSCH
jgi:hypothetical protein